jgi:hypothetical protein
MPIVPGIHVFFFAYAQDVDGQDKPGHDERNSSRSRRRREEAAPRSVRPLAAPVGAVRRGLRLPERNDLAIDHMIAGTAHLHVLGRTTKQSPAPQHHSPATLRKPPAEIQLSCANAGEAPNNPVNKADAKQSVKMRTIDGPHGLSRRGDS